MASVNTNTPPPAAESSTGLQNLRDYLQVLRRRRGIVVAVFALVLGASVLRSELQDPIYQSAAEVLLSRQNLATSLTNTTDPTASAVDYDRIVQTQADIAESPAILNRTAKALNLTRADAAALSNDSSVTAKPDADILIFRARSPQKLVAKNVTNELAQQYTLYRRQLDTQALQRARADVSRRIAEIRKNASAADARLLSSLSDNEQKLATLEALQTSNAFVVRQAGSAVQISPRPVRAAILGLILGIGLGIGAAFLRDALDTRVRSAEEVGDRLKLPLLARVAEPPRRLRSEDGLVMLKKPGGQHAEAFRVLRTNLEFALLDHSAKRIMVTSAVQAEGKSTTVANLAVAFARAGRKVVLIDLDLRRPYQAKFFKLQGQPGLTNVALGQVSLEDALATVDVTALDSGEEEFDDLPPLYGPDEIENESVEKLDATSLALAHTGNGSSGQHQESGELGRAEFLRVLPSGPTPPDPGEFVGSTRLAHILAEVDKEADVVLIDAPPLLRVGDALTLSAHVDSLFLVTRLFVFRRPMMKDIGRLLEASPARKLGFVVTGAELDEAYYYSYAGYYYGYTPAPASKKQKRAARLSSRT